MKHLQLRALVADDDPLSRGIVAEQLLRLRVGSVTTAASGNAALQILQQDKSIGLLVTDLKMPDMDGIALLGRLATLNRPISVIIMSALGDKILRAAEMIGLGHHLRILGVSGKPVRLQRLRDMLDRSENIPPPKRPGDDRAATIDPGQIREALADGGYYIVVQPEIEARSGRFIGVEVLSRFNHEGLARFTPGDIILSAEQSSLIHDILGHTLKQVGRASRAWRRAGLNPTVSINLSHRNLADPDFPEWFGGQIALHALSPADIILEITETAVPLNETTNLEVAHRLGLQGFKLAIDDYGTGHANLQQLQNMPFHQLKVDKSFVDNIEHSFDARTIVSSSLQMARNLGLKTVAEGVEQAAQDRLLRDMGCDLMQGYYYARPMPADQLADWALAHRARHQRGGSQAA